MTKRIGVLALQGDFAEHIAMLHKLGVEALPVRLPRELDGLDGLVIPGGESTTIGKLMEDYGVMEPVRRLACDSFPIMGTCAGMVLLSQKSTDLSFDPMGAIDIDVERNAFGRQRESFQVKLNVKHIGEFEAVFIRAPAITKVGEGVEVLATFEDYIVAVQQDNILGLAFHPELTDDTRIHEYFLKMALD